MRSSISQRIGFGLLIMLALQLALLITLGLSVTNYRANAVQLAAETIPQIATINALNTATQRAALETLHYLINPQAEHLDHHSKAMQLAESNLAMMRMSFAEDQSNASDERAAFVAFDQAVSAALAFSTDVMTRRQQGATIDINAVTETLDANTDRVESTFIDLTTLLDDEVMRARTATQSNPLFWPAIIGVLALLVSGGLFALLIRTIVHPLRELHTAALAVAAGVWDRRVPTSGTQEISALGQAFTIMTTTVRDQIATAEAARRAAETAQHQTAAQLATIEAQQAVIRELSVPLLPLTTSALVLPLVGALDSARFEHIQQHTLDAVKAARARHLLVDVTGVPLLDQHLSQELLRLVQATRLLGAEVILVGIRAEVAQTLVGLGVDLQGMTIHSTLQQGVAYILHREASTA